MFSPELTLGKRIKASWFWRLSGPPPDPSVARSLAVNSISPIVSGDDNLVSPGFSSPISSIFEVIKAKENLLRRYAPSPMAWRIGSVSSVFTNNLAIVSSNLSPLNSRLCDSIVDRNDTKGIMTRQSWTLTNDSIWVSSSLDKPIISWSR